MSKLTKSAVLLIFAFAVGYIHYPYQVSGIISREAKAESAQSSWSGPVASAEVRGRPELAPKPPAPPKAPKPETFTTAALIKYSNQARARFGLRPLSYDRGLARSAQCKLKDLLTHRYWAHDRPGLSWLDCFKKSGYKYGGENLAKCYSSPSEAVQGWLGSPSHRDNLLSSSWSRIAVVAGFDSWGRCWVIVQHLAG